MVKIVNNTSLNQPILLSSYSDWKPKHLALDWIHNLLYFIDDHSDIRVSNMFQLNQSVHLINRDQVTILKLFVCPKLSMLVWQEVEWNGMNYNSIQIAQQDGTEIRQIFHSQTFIQDIVLDQSNLLVYFVTNNFLGMISLKDYHQTESLPNGSRHVQKFPLFTDFSHFSILGTYILMLQYGNLGFQNLQNSNQVVAPSSKLSLTNLIQNEFRLIHAYSQPASHLVCTPEKSKICTDICLPNGYVAQFTCYCYNDNLCDEHGHHSFDNEQTESNQTLIISSGQNTLKDVQSNSILATVTSMKDEQRNKEHFISEDIWSRIEETTSNSIIVQNSTEITIQVQVSTISDISGNKIICFIRNLMVYCYNFTEKKNPTTFKPRDNQFTSIFKFILFFGSKFFYRVNKYNQTSSETLILNTNQLNSFEKWFHKNRTFLIIISMISLIVIIFLIILLSIFLASLIMKVPKIKKTIRYCHTI